MRIFSDLLFQHGHIADVDLARSLAEEAGHAPEQAEQRRRRRERRNLARRRLALRAAPAMSLFR